MHNDQPYRPRKAFINLLLSGSAVSCAIQKRNGVIIHTALKRSSLLCLVLKTRWASRRLRASLIARLFLYL